MAPAPTLTNAAKYWQHILNQQRSGLDITAYCREHKLTVSCLFNRLRKLKLADNAPAPQRFVPVTIASGLLSLSPSAKQHNLNTWLYLKDLLSQLPIPGTNLDSLLPDRWRPAA